MKLRRLRHKAAQSIHWALELNEGWLELSGAPDELLLLLASSTDELQKRYALEPIEEAVFEVVLPFQPTAYRDFMLYEQHAIEAARGFARKYLPRMMPLIQSVEKLTGKPFPKLKPAARYYEYPIYYMGSHLNMVTHGDQVCIPAYTQELDYELELAAILGRPLKNATPEEAESAIAGFVILNDFSARDVQLSEMKSGFGPMKAKNFANAISAEVVSADELLPIIEQLAVRVLINGAIVAHGHSGGKRYSFGEAIAYASWEEPLHAGELFGSGTLPGCAGIENGHLLNAGDVVRLEVDSLGVLENRIG